MAAMRSSVYVRKRSAVNSLRPEPVGPVSSSSNTAVGVPPRDCNLSSLLEDPRGDAHLAQEGTSMGMELLAPIALPTDSDARRRKFHADSLNSRAAFGLKRTEPRGPSSCRVSRVTQGDVSPPSKQINLSKRGIKRDQSFWRLFRFSNVSNGGSHGQILNENAECPRLPPRSSQGCLTWPLPRVWPWCASVTLTSSGRCRGT